MNADRWLIFGPLIAALLLLAAMYAAPRCPDAGAGFSIGNIKFGGC